MKDSAAMRVFFLANPKKMIDKTARLSETNKASQYPSP